MQTDYEPTMDKSFSAWFCLRQACEFLTDKNADFSAQRLWFV